MASKKRAAKDVSKGTADEVGDEKGASGGAGAGAGGGKRHKGDGRPDITEECTCPVCMEVFEEPVPLPCGHVCCRPCLVDTAKSAAGPKCPSCRAPFPHPALPSVSLPLQAIADKLVAGQQEQLDRRLALAVRDCRPARVDALLAMGASAKAPGPDGVEDYDSSDGLLFFCTWKRGEHNTASGARIAAALMRAGAVPDEVDLYNPCFNSHVPEWAAVALEMARRGAPPTHMYGGTDEHTKGSTALACAIINAHARLCLALIAAGAAVNGTVQGKSFVKLAAGNKKLHGVVVAMLDKGAVVEKGDNELAEAVGKCLGLWLAWQEAHPLQVK